MSEIIKLSPVTRLEGHLSVKVECDAGRVTNAYVSGEMFRGFEIILRGRDPLDAQYITQRICGVCPVDHGVASILAQDMAYKVVPPDNGRITRNLIQAANFLASHITHFYLLSGLDFVDVAMITEYQGKDQGLIELKNWVQSQLSSNQVYPAAPFLPRYAAKYIQDKEANFGVLKHYLDALQVRATAHKMGAVFAGKMPHAASLVPGGVTEKMSVIQIASYRSYLQDVQNFIDHSYLPDVAAVAGLFPEYFNMGRGPGNFLAYGGFPESSDGKSKLLPGGVLMGDTLAELDHQGITEDVGQSLFSSASGLKPSEGETVAAPDKKGAYSWLKAPRYKGSVVEVGPLARYLVGYHAGNAAIKDGVDGLLKALDRKPGDLNSVLGRHAARALEAKLVADRCAQWIEQLTPDAPAFTDFQIPDSAAGFGLTEAARGALGHWIEIRGGKIANYQCVVPTTWNCSPRDDKGVAGAIEQALVGTPVANAENPIEVARVIRSFDPCLACAVH